MSSNPKKRVHAGTEPSLVGIAKETRAELDSASPRRHTFGERSVPCSGGSLFAVEAGESNGPAVLLVHGYPDSHRVWLPVMEELADTHHVCAYDVRGAGASYKPSDVPSYRMSHLADDMEAVASEVFKDRPYHIVGHDWGGIQSWETISRPEARSRVASFMSVSGPCLDHVAVWMREELRAGGARRWAVLRQSLNSMYIPVLLTPGAPGFLWRFVLANSWREEHGDPSGERFQTLESDGALGANLYRANVTDALSQPRTITSAVPTRLVGLGQDPYVGTDSMRASIGHLDDASYEELDEDHWSVFGSPEQFSRVIARWVALHGAEPRSA